MASTSAEVANRGEACRTANLSRDNLPVQLTSFLGREREMRQLTLGPRQEPSGDGDWRGRVRQNPACSAERGGVSWRSRRTAHGGSSWDRCPTASWWDSPSLAC